MNIPPTDTAPLPGNVRPPPRKHFRWTRTRIIIAGVLVLFVGISVAARFNNNNDSRAVAAPRASSSSSAQASPSRSPVTTVAPTTSAPTTSAPASPAAPGQPGGPPLTAGPAGPTCAQQVTKWLALTSTGAYVPADTNLQVIRAIINDADAYLKYSSADQTGATGQNFLTFMGNEAGMLGEIGPTVNMPSCADPQDLLGADNADNGTLVGDATDASEDTANTSQANADVQATINDLAAINAELKTTGPGAVISGSS